MDPINNPNPVSPNPSPVTPPPVAAPAPMPTPAPVAPSVAPAQMPSEHQGKTGLLMAISVIAAVVLVGALYFWQQRSVDLGQSAAESDAQAQSITTQNTSDDTSSIEADLESTDVDNLDAELNTI